MNNELEKALYKAVAILIVAVIGSLLFLAISPSGREALNNWQYSLKKVDDKTSYEKEKKVEDTCRSMVASYESDKLIYDQYKNSQKSEEQSWAQQAKMRANKTASSYNNYVLENSFVWDGNVPRDISADLSYIQ